MHGADELYIKAAEDFPPIDDYGEFPQMKTESAWFRCSCTRPKRLNYLA